MWVPVLILILQATAVQSCFDATLEWQAGDALADHEMPEFFPRSVFEQGALIDTRRLIGVQVLDASRKYLALTVRPSPPSQSCSTHVKVWYRFPVNTDLEMAVMTPRKPSVLNPSPFAKECEKSIVTLLRAYHMGVHPSTAPADFYIHHDSDELKYLVFQVKSRNMENEVDAYKNQAGNTFEILDATSKTRCRDQSQQQYLRGRPAFASIKNSASQITLDASLHWKDGDGTGDFPLFSSPADDETEQVVEMRELDGAQELDPTKEYLALTIRPNPAGKRCSTHVAFQYKFPLHVALDVSVYNAGLSGKRKIVPRGLGIDKHPSKFLNEFHIQHANQKLQYLVVTPEIKDMTRYSKYFKKFAGSSYELLEAKTETRCKGQKKARNSH